MVLYIIAVPTTALAQNFYRCIHYSLSDSFPRIKHGEKSNLFVKCSSDNTAPIPGQPRPQYSDSEIKSLTQAFESITNCLDIDPTWLFPKLMAESGFHTQIQNPRGDAGIGQLTSKAITDVDQVLPFYKKMIFNSTKESCLWIKNKTQQKTNFWAPLNGKSKCALMSKNSNPLRNLLYVGIFHKINEQYLEREFEKRQIAKLMLQAGYPKTDFTRLKRILLTLGYNTGGASAVRNLEEFLFSRIDYIHRKRQETNVNPKDLAYVTDEDFDFSQVFSTFSLRKNAYIEQVRQSNRQLTDDEVELTVQRLLRNVSVSQYTFPEWLLVWQSHGGPGYVSTLTGFAKKIDAKFGIGVCSNATYYRLSDE